MRNRPSFKQAVEWIAGNDDTEWVAGEPDSAIGCPSVTAALVADLFGYTTEEVRAAIVKELTRQRAAEAAADAKHVGMLLDGAEDDAERDAILRDHSKGAS